mgnify:CR=1 FL=1
MKSYWEKYFKGMLLTFTFLFLALNSNVSQAGGDPEPGDADYGGGTTSSGGFSNSSDFPGIGPGHYHQPDGGRTDDGDNRTASPKHTGTGLMGGRIQGQFNVDAKSGGATYAMQIAVPKGHMAMEPKLSLVYSSGGGFGHFGTGWELTGLHTLHRCGSNAKYDGAAIDNKQRSQCKKKEFYTGTCSRKEWRTKWHTTWLYGCTGGWSWRGCGGWGWYKGPSIPTPYLKTVNYSCQKDRIVNGACETQKVPRGNKGPVGVPHQDRLCLDGARLVLTGGEYGKSNSTYRVSNSRNITAKVKGSGCSLWATGMDNCEVEVTKPNGNVLTFEQEHDRRKMHLQRVTDTSGNFMEVTWRNWGNETVLREIQYTGTKNHNPTRKVLFDYRWRADKRNQYWASIPINMHHIVQRIRVQSLEGGSWQDLTEYNFNFKRGKTTKRNLLAWIQMCGKSYADEGGSGQKVCLPETSFNYSDGNHKGPLQGSNQAWGNFKSWGGNNKHPHSNGDNPSIKMLGDTNGDGLQDLVWVMPAGDEKRYGGLGEHDGSARMSYDNWGTHNTHKVDVACTAVSTGKGFKPPVCKRIMALSTRSEAESYNFVDVNGDGALDVVAFSESHNNLNNHGIIVNQGIRITKNNLGSKNGAGFHTNYRAANPLVGQYHNRHLVDGYGKNGIFDSSWWSGQYEECAKNGGSRYCNDHTKREIRDVNGDGLPDLVLFGMWNVEVALGNPDKPGSFKDPASWLGSKHHANEGSPTWKSGSWNNTEHARMLCDINGDGLPDILGFGHSQTSVWYNSGHSFANKDSQLANGSVLNEFTVSKGWKPDQHRRTCADVNGDGLADIVGFGGSKTFVYISTGRGFEKFATINNFGSNKWEYTEEIRGVQDLNADGLADIYGFESSGRILAAFGTGSGFTKPVAISTQGFTIGDGWQAGKNPRFFMDVNGDGCPDLVGYGNNDAIVRINTSCDSQRGIKPDVLVGVYDGNATNAGQAWSKARNHGIEITYGTINHPVHGLIKNNQYKETYDLSKKPDKYIGPSGFAYGIMKGSTYGSIRQRHPSPIVRTTVIRDVSKSGHEDRSHDRKSKFFYENYIAAADRSGGSGFEGQESWLEVKDPNGDLKKSGKRVTFHGQSAHGKGHFLMPHKDYCLNNLNGLCSMKKWEYSDVGAKISGIEEYRPTKIYVYRANPTNSSRVESSATLMAVTTKEYDDDGLLEREWVNYSGASLNYNQHKTTCHTYLKDRRRGFEKPTKTVTRSGARKSCSGALGSNDRVSEMKYDNAGRIRSRWEGAGESTSAGVASQQTDFYYDDIGRLVTVVDPSGLERRYDDFTHHHQQRRVRAVPTDETIGAGEASELPIATQKTTYTRTGLVATTLKGTDKVDESKWIPSKTEYDPFGRVLRSYSKDDVEGGKDNLHLVRQIRYVKVPESAGKWYGVYGMMTFSRPADFEGKDDWCGRYNICKFGSEHNAGATFTGLINSTNGQIFSHEFSDTFGQVIRSEKHGLNTDDERIIYKNEFNEMGNVIRQYMPFSTNSNTGGAKDIYQEFTYLQGTHNILSNVQKDGGNEIHGTRYAYEGPGGLKIVKTFPSPSGSGDSTITIWKSIEGKQVQKDLPNGGRVISRYNAHGQLNYLRDPIGGVTTKAYNSLGQVLWQAKGDLGREEFKYNKLGKVAEKKIGTGEITAYAYDKLGRLSTVVNSQGQATSYFYNPMGALRGTVDGNGNSEMVQFNEAHQKIGGAVTIDGQVFTTMAGGLAGTSILPTGDKLYTTKHIKGINRQVALNGQVVAETLDFDHLGQAKTLRYANGDVATASYDKFGKNVGLTVKCGDGKGFSDDGEWIGGGGGKVCHTETSTFNDSIGKLTGATRSSIQSEGETGVGGEAGSVSLTTSYSYDKMGRLTNTSTNKNHNQTFSYDLNSNLTSVRGTDAVNYYHFGSGSSRLSGTSNGAKYTYDKAGRVIIKAVWDKGINSFKTWKFTYESRYNKVIRIEGPEGTTIYERNALGGIAKTIKPNGDIILNIGPGVELRKNVLGSVHVSVSVALMGKQVHTFTTDATPAQASAFMRKIEHNNHQLMAGVFDPGTLIGFLKFSYHKFSQVLSRPNFEQELLKGTCIVFAVGLFLGMLFNIFRKRAVGKVKWWHYPMIVLMFSVTTVLPVQALDSGYEGRGNYELGAQYFHTDHLGNTALVTNDKGRITSSVAYDSYGNILEQGSFGRDNFPNKWAHAKHINERGKDSGLSLMGARIYDRDARRFLSPDPKSVFHSPYRYSSDPIGNTDPSGEEPFTIACIVIFALIALFTTGYAISGTWRFWRWDKKTWGFAVLGGIAGAAFAAAAAFALPALAAACATACPGVAAAAGGTASVTSTAGLKALAFQAAVAGTLGAAEAAVASMIVQAGQHYVNGRAFSWSEVGQAAGMGFVMGAGFTAAGAIVGSVMKPLAGKADDWLKTVAKDGASKAMEKISNKLAGIVSMIDNFLSAVAPTGWQAVKNMAGTIGSKIGRVCRAIHSTIIKPLIERSAEIIASAKKHFDNFTEWLGNQVAKVDDPKWLKEWMDNPGNWKGYAQKADFDKFIDEKGIKIFKKGMKDPDNMTMTMDMAILDFKKAKLEASLDGIDGWLKSAKQTQAIKAEIAENVTKRASAAADFDKLFIKVDDLRFAKPIENRVGYGSFKNAADGTRYNIHKLKDGGLEVVTRGSKSVVIPKDTIETGFFMTDDAYNAIKAKHGDGIADFLKSRSSTQGGPVLKAENVGDFKWGRVDPDFAKQVQQLTNVPTFIPALDHTALVAMTGMGATACVTTLCMDIKTQKADALEKATAAVNDFGDAYSSTVSKIKKGCATSPHEEGCAAVRGDAFGLVWFDDLLSLAGSPTSVAAWFEMLFTYGYTSDSGLDAVYGGNKNIRNAMRAGLRSSTTGVTSWVMSPLIPDNSAGPGAWGSAGCDPNDKTCGH